MSKTPESNLSGSFEKELTNIKTLINQKKFSQAIQHASRLLFLNPSILEAYYFRGIAYAQICDIHSALHDIQHVIDLDPLNSEATSLYSSLNFNEGLLQFEKKQYSVALKHFSRTTRYDRQNINSRYYSALSHIALSQYSEALSVLLEANSIKHHPIIDALLSNLSLHFNNLPDAYRYASSSLSSDPTNPHALKVIDIIKCYIDKTLTTIDEILLSNNNCETALTYINNLLEIRPDIITLRIYKSIILRSINDLVNAEQELIDILDQTTNNEAQRQLSLTYNDMGIQTFMNGNVKESIIWFDTAMREYPNDPNFYINKGDCYRILNEYETSLANYHKAKELGLTGECLDKRIAITHYALARNALKKNNNKAALYELDKAIANYNKFADFFVVRAKVNVTLNQIENALNDLENALKIDPNNIEAKKLLNVQNEEMKRKRKNVKRKIKPKITKVNEIQPFSIEDLRNRPFDYLNGTKKLPRKR
ncbi:tetratricopeptide repeat protein 16 [Histomonas meleagridis]|uniref:tetratricopeptide repeat protein 16 n=1 Tax=Histomonas meleagridis TaxID=135588 RepID=UPI00355AB077|nr:tetratricopeptide repeat protein 16 [Histomonas meleagridis]KAH0804456.1 tetratricopeptide repeat protein 16 [Histomonas meleagridis]